MSNTDEPRPVEGIVGRWFRKIFCVHRFIGINQDKYNVIRGDGTKEGEVTLLHLRCSNCGYEKVIPVDRTHLTPNAAHEPPATKTNEGE